MGNTVKEVYQKTKEQEEKITTKDEHVSEEYKMFFSTSWEFQKGGRENGKNDTRKVPRDEHFLKV